MGEIDAKLVEITRRQNNLEKEEKLIKEQKERLDNEKQNYRNRSRDFKVTNEFKGKN